MSFISNAVPVLPALNPSTQRCYIRLLKLALAPASYLFDLNELCIRVHSHLQFIRREFLRECTPVIASRKPHYKDRKTFLGEQ